MDKEYFMRQALELAKQALADGEVPVGAVVVKDSRIIGRGRNRREEKKNVLAHAEIEAINEACKALGNWRLNDCELYVTLEPCAMCCGAIINSRIGKIVFGAYDEKAGVCISSAQFFDLPFSQKIQMTGGYMERECAALLEEFFLKLR